MRYIFNLKGLLVALGSIGLACVGSQLYCGQIRQDVAMIIAGPIAVYWDFWHRKRHKRSVLLGPDGPSLFFLPVWAIGVAWFVVGVARAASASDSVEQALLVIVAVLIGCLYAQYLP